MSTITNIEIAKTYFGAVARGDLDTVSRCFAEDIEWHQPGQGQLSGLHKGKDQVFALLGKFMDLSLGSFRLDEVGRLMAQGDLVAVPVHFRAERGDAKISMSGIDVMRIEGGTIREMWLFSEDQAAEDAFWG